MEQQHERPEQIFQFGDWIFDVDQAQALIAEHPRTPVSLPVGEWARQYGLDLLDEPGRVPILGIGPDFDAAYALATDLTQPLIVATLRSEERGTYPLLIDGTHRLYRAYREGVPDLSAYVLNAVESLSIRLDRHHR